MNQPQLQALINACRQNDRQCQEQLYRKFFNYGMTICSRYAQNEEEAREMLNDGFIKVFSRLEQYSDNRSFKGWLNRILVNTAIDYYRKRKHDPQVVELVHAQHYSSVGANALEQIGEKEILALVQKLPPSYRIVFSLHVVEGYSHPEIAEKLGISVGTSKSNLAKARTKLKAMLYKIEEKRNKYG